MTNTPTRHFDLIILGGGLAGASLAAALRDSGRRIALVEGRPPAAPDPDGAWDHRVYAISPASARFLQRAGIGQALAADRVAPVYDMRVAGDAGGAIHFSAYECGVDALSHIAESGRLAHALWQALAEQPGLQVFAPAQAAGLDLGGDRPGATATLCLGDGNRLAAPLVVAADGRASWARTAVGLAATVSPYDELGVVANFACELPHRGTAFQWFRDDGVLAWLPLPGRVISIVWSAPRAQAEALLALSPDSLAARVGAAGGHRLGTLTPLSAAAGFPLQLMTVPAAFTRRLVLIGDAAHGIHPLSGHGINLGFADAAELAQRIRRAPAAQDLGAESFLRAYARARRTETVLLQQGTDALHRLFHNRLPKLPGLPELPAPPGLARLRNLGLDLTDRLSPLKSWLARLAMG